MQIIISVTDKNTFQSGNLIGETNFFNALILNWQ